MHLCTVVAPRSMANLGGGIKLSVGYNTSDESYSGCKYGCHSEMMALTKLKRNKSGRLIPIDVFVTRVNKLGERRNSKPCTKCIKYMNLIVKHGYRVINVYYPDESGTIIKQKFSMLLDSNDKHVSSRFSRSSSGSGSDSSSIKGRRPRKYKRKYHKSKKFQ